jgi:monovalent cation:H+ antiporter-2, CPA2 family
MTSLELTLLFLLAAVLGVVACRTLKLPPILGYLAVGVLIGPNALGALFDMGGNAQSVRHLAEFGVVFLMFAIGLEFNLPKLRAMRKHVFGLGLLQVLLTMLIASTVSLVLVWLVPGQWHMSWQSALALGSALAMSSTAIVVKLMADRIELESEHGKRVMGVLLFQDLAVVPLLVLIPALGSSAESLAGALTIAAAKATVLVTFLLVGGQRLMRWWLTLVVRRQSQELFVLNLLLMTLGLAWLTELAGLSLALGAFIAGMLIAETEFRHQVETDIRPFHDVLLGLFFITIGMMLDWRLVLARWPLVLVMLVLPVLFKFVMIALLARLLKAPTGVALRTGLYLAQAGEFGFVLLALSQQYQLVPPALLNPILASMVLSVLPTPFIVQHSNAIVMKLAANEWMMQSLAVTQIASKSINTSRHVIVCGFGRSGQSLAHVLASEKIPYLALDLDPDRVRQASGAGEPVVFGDATRQQALMAAGLARASAVVVTYQNTPGAMKVLALVREHAPKVPVIVRTLDDRDLETLQGAGATEVVPEAIEGSLMLASHALALVGVPMRRVIRVVQDQRDARYAMLRGYFHGADDDNADDMHLERLQTVTVVEGAKAVGQPLHALDLPGFDVRVVSLCRGRARPQPSPGVDTLLHAGDVLVLSGRPQGLALAEERLLKG